MFKKILILLKKYFYSNELLININQKIIPEETQGFNHLNIFFNQNNNLKNSIITKKYIKTKSNKYRDSYYNTFEWLLTAKKIGGAESLYFSKNQIKLWIKENYSINSIFWNNKYTSDRLINLLYAYDFYAITSDKKEIFFFNKIIYKHHLLNEVFIKNLSIEKLSIENSKASLLSNLIYKKKIDNLIKLIKFQIRYHVDISGFHKSYNPVFQAQYINNLQEIKNILLYYKIDDIKELNFQINNMTSVLNSLFHKDGSLALFNGSHNCFNKEIIKIIKQVDDLKDINLYSIKNGLAVYGDKYKKIFFDVVKPTNKFINKHLHSGTLSFEFSGKKEKIITNCGSINKVFSKKPEYLKYTAAHSSITLNNTNISELDNKKSYLRIPDNITYESDENEKKIFFEASHDGYKKNFKKIVKRKIIIYKNENIVFGEDSIMPIKLYSKNDIYNIRFHLMPHCQCNLTNSKKKVIIKTKNKNTWLFEANSEVTVEESIYINEENKVEQNKQIVISGFVKDIKRTEFWSIKEA